MQVNIFVFGDSITQGFYDAKSGGWVSLLFAALNERTLDTNIKDFFSVFNLGISGDRVADVLTRFDSDVKSRLQERESIVILDIGGNDSTRNLVTNETVCLLPEFSKQYRELIQKAKKHGTVICLGLHDSDESKLNPTPFWKNHAILSEDGKKFDDEIRKIASQEDVHFISMRGVLSVNLEANLVDGDHPSAQGHQLIFEHVKDVLEKRHIL